MDSSVKSEEFSPDLASLQPIDIPLPTEFISEEPLSISELISSVGTGTAETIASYTVDPNTVAGQDQALNIILEPSNIDIQSMMNGFGESSQINIMQHTNQQQYGAQVQAEEPWVQILEQPKSNNLRFRYECEGKGAGALQGYHSTQDIKTFPKIKVHGYKGLCTVVVSCVTDNQDPPQAHPHNLVSPASVPNGCKFGVCTQNINPDTMEVEFPHLGIQCVRRKDIKKSLELRKEKKIDPYSQGFKHIDNPEKIDLNAVRLCFHVWREYDKKGKCTRPLKPVCSDTIYDAKAKKELQICNISDTTSPASGDKKIIILCEKISRDDIKIRFYDEYGWEAYADFPPSAVHKLYAVAFKTPRYKDVGVKKRVRVQVELCNTNDRSEPKEFFYLPVDKPGTVDSDWSSAPSQSVIRTRVATGEEQKDIKMESKKEIKMESPMFSPSRPGQEARLAPPRPQKSPYTQIQMGQQGFVLSEKNDLSSDLSLTNIQPSLIPTSSSQMENLMMYGDMQHQLGNNIMQQQQHLPQLQQQQLNQQQMAQQHHMNQQQMSPASSASGYSPVQSTQYTPTTQQTLVYQNMNLRFDENVGTMVNGDTVNDLQYFLANPPIDNLSETLTHNLNIQDPQLEEREEGKGQGGGKRSQKDANLDSGRLQVAYQQARTEDTALYSNKPNLSRQQSSLNTPTVSEQLTSNNSMNLPTHIAGGSYNKFDN